MSKSRSRYGRINLRRLHFLLGVSLLALAPLGLASIHAEANRTIIQVELSRINAEVPEFHGLAAFYNKTEFYLATPIGLQKVELEDSVVLKSEHTFLAIGRVSALVASGPDCVVTARAGSLHFSFPNNLPGEEPVLMRRADLGSINPDLPNLRYVGLWKPLAALARSVEWLLVQIQRNVVTNWGLAIITLAVVLKILLFPLSLMTVRAQRKVGEYQSKLAPKLAEIRANFRGEEAHNRTIAAHKELGITPFFTLRPMAATLVQIPVLIAVFNALGEMPHLFGESFLWMGDLSLPDAITDLPFTVPLLGNTLNLLPFLMTTVSVAATLLFTNRSAPERTVKHQKRNLYIMSAAFFILFYPFPASMVLYWTVSNALQIVQQKIIKT